jgi:glucose/arabinose dehydrogenase
MSPRRLCARWAGALLLTWLTAARSSALPSGFSESDLGGGWNEVAGLAFSADGTRLYVVERGGKVWILENGVKQPTPFLDISDEVGGWRDFGLLGFALHPNFEHNGYVYALYVVDRYYLFNHGTPDYDPALLESQRFQATIGRISRFTADPATGFRTVLPGSQVILVGATREDGIPILHESHGTGQLAFGQDGTLLATDGDGASYASADNGSAAETYWSQALGDGIIESFENVGAWRSQLVGSYSGKVLRIDPITGEGISSNPWYDPAAPASVRSRTFAVGLRNPYRFSYRPGTGSHDPADGNPGVFYIGDVGWNSSEDLQILEQGGQNFGWPAFEGINQRATSTGSSQYWNGPGPADGTLARQNPLAKNPLGSQPGCIYPFLRFRDLIDQESRNPSDPPSWPNPCNPAVQIPDQWMDPSDGTLYRYEKFVHSRPPIAWRGNAWVSFFTAQGNPTHATLGTTQSPVAGSSFPGNASTGGVWYTGTDFPPEWQNTYFHGDYGAGWIKSFGFDAEDQLLDVVDFLPAGNSVTFIATNPVSGGLYYVRWGDRVRRIRWVGTGNSPPVAVLTPPVAWSTSSQLAVSFTGSGSTDPDADAVLSWFWDFGDGTTSTAADPQHTFTAAGQAPQTFLVRLTVSDEDGNVDDAEVRVSLNNSPPSVQLDSPLDGSAYSTAGPTLVPVRSTVSDAEHGAAQLACLLQVELVHNNHTHPEPSIAACEADVPIDPVGCDGNEYSWRFTLTVTDPEGLATRAVSRMLPDCTPPVCGDGVAEAPEECDDGDPTPGDCCSPSCTFEPAGSGCPGDGNVCSHDVCDGAGVCSHPPEPDGAPCSDGDVCSAPDQCAAGTCSSIPLPDTDLDGSCDAIDADDDGDGVEDAADAQPLNRFACRDSDADSCDDCSSGSDAPANDGLDTDADGSCNAGDPDDDNDGVADAADTAPLDRLACRDVDADSCDDCSSGSDAPANDGLDTDADGSCNAGDPDDDGDGVADAADAAPLDRHACRDVDADSCDDCSGGSDAPGGDGPDTDGDGSCNAGDPDDDNDGVVDGADAQPLNRFACRDVDADSCDDCSSGSDAPANDGLDADGDGSCDAGDPDDDGDGVADAADAAPLDRLVCRDVDADSCDDCSGGSDAPGSDGPDTDGDGSCNAGDPDDDNDGVVDGADAQPLDRSACRDVDADSCDDCSSGSDAPANDGLDTDGDGSCDAGDPDDDGDGVADAADAAPLDRHACRDLDADSCDDCSSGTDTPAADGRDTDADGECDAGDPDDDGDGVLDAGDNCPFYASADLADTDGDGRGDVCECTDQNGDGRNTVMDLIAINRAIFNPALASALCDGNADGACTVSDIIAANLEIYSPTNTSTCARQPVPGP